ncbi:hypothetical protein [Citricoccus alkalitolerans]|uniref:PknH-like extracellular domain-containing protein n=1 Tax=Citricoccus alkalitolerans TaxID=246603 RepID=A0ABV8Y495_9MICC
MNSQHTRFRTATLPSIVGIGLLALSLAACGGPGDEGESSAPASSDAANEASESPAPSATEDDTASASATASPDASSSDDAAAAGDVEAALKAVLGEGTQIVTGSQLEELQQSSQGLTEGITITPAECGPEGQDAATGELPEGTELIGGVVVETTETGGANSDMLSVSVYPDAAAATEGMAAFEEFAAACPSYSLEMGEGLNAEATMTVEDIEAEGDASLAITISTTVDIEGASLPAGAGNSISTTVYVQDGERLISYAGTAAGGEPKTAAEGVELIDALRAELGG